MNYLKQFSSSLKKMDKHGAILFSLIVLSSSAVFISMQYFVTEHQNYFGSFVIGVLVGLLFACIALQNIPAIFSKTNFLLKCFALLLPFGLLFGFIIPHNMATYFYCVFFIVFYIVLVLAFILPIQNKGMKLCSALILLAAFFAIEYSFFVYDLYSADTMSCYDIAQSIFTDFYKVSTQRQYTVDTDLGISFPYLYPTLIAIFDFFTGLKLYAATIVNVITACLTCFVLYKISLKHFKGPYPGTIAAVFLMTNANYLSEMRQARAVPLTILFVLIAIYGLLHLPKITKSMCFFAGVAAGCSMVVRFDALVTTGMGFVAVLLFSVKNQKIKNAAIYAAGVLVFTTPWILLSLIGVGSPWVSDNGGTMFMTMPSIPQRYYSPDYVYPTIFNDFNTWVDCLFKYKLPWVIEYGFLSCVNTLSNIGIAVWAGLVLIKSFQGKTLKMIKLFFKAKKQLLIGCLFILITYLGKVASIVLVGYVDSRYHCESWVMLVLVISAILYSFFSFTKKVQNQETEKTVYSFDHKKASNNSFLNTVTVLCCAVVIFFTGTENWGMYSDTIFSNEILTTPASVQILKEVVTQKTDDPAVLFLTDNTSPYAFGAYSQITTYCTPHIAGDDPEALYLLTDNFVHPDYVIADTYNGEYFTKYGLVEVYTDGASYSVYEVTNKSSYSDTKTLLINK